MQLKVKKMKVCIAGGRGSNQVVFLFLDGENCSISHWMTLRTAHLFIIHKFHLNLFLESPKIFEYFVAERKYGNNFQYSV